MYSFKTKLNLDVGFPSRLILIKDKSSYLMKTLLWSFSKKIFGIQILLLVTLVKMFESFLRLMKLNLQSYLSNFQPNHFALDLSSGGTSY